MLSLSFLISLPKLSLFKSRQGTIHFYNLIYIISFNLLGLECELRIMGNTCGQYCAREDGEPSELLTVDNKVSQLTLLSLFMTAIDAVRQIKRDFEANEEIPEACAQNHPLASFL